MAQAMIDYQTYSQYPKPNRVEEDRDMQTLLDIFSEETGSQQDQDFFQDDKDVQKNNQRKSQIQTSAIPQLKQETRNLLTNVLYRRYKQKDITNASFIIDILSFFVQIYNPIGLERKLERENEKQYINDVGYLSATCFHLLYLFER